MANDIGIIGGGWAGMAAALTLAAAGEQVTVYEAARTLGGRARRVSFSANDTSLILDNGQHILLGAYHHTLALLKQVGVSLDVAFLTTPLQFLYPDGWAFRSAHLPAPLHTLVGLLRTPSLTIYDKFSLAKKLWKARQQNWLLPSRISVAEWIADQSPTLRSRLWIPLCLAAMNTSINEACAQVFLNILRISLGGHHSDSVMLLPRFDLSALFPEAAAAYLNKHASNIKLGARIRAIKLVDNQWELELAGNAHAHAIGSPKHQALILATAPYSAGTLLETVAPTQPQLRNSIDILNQLRYESIITIYLAYPGRRLKNAFYALQTDANNPGQFIFDRAYLQDQHAGIMAVVISAPEPAVVALAQAELVERVHQQLQRTFNWSEPYAWQRVVHEKNATFRCTSNLKRITNPMLIDTPPLLIAGDFMPSSSGSHLDYPATLESAVRSGIEAAQRLLENRSTRIGQPACD